MWLRAWLARNPAESRGPIGAATLLQSTVCALRKLLILDAAEAIVDLRIPPGNRLEKLSGNRAGQHSIRINDQWRICFRWRQADAYDVEVVDYHA